MGVGPSTKQTTLHHFRDPLVEVLGADTDIDFLGVIVFGSSEIDEEKHFISRRAAIWAEAMRADGVIVSADGWGNHHIDFANAMKELGERGLPAVGVTFQGTVGTFVVQNKYLGHVIDTNKSVDGTETTVLEENVLEPVDARKAAAMLKLLMRKAK